MRGKWGGGASWPGSLFALGAGREELKVDPSLRSDSGADS